MLSSELNYNSSDFVTALNAYYANEEETEEDCLNTYRENVRQADEDLVSGFLASTVFLFFGVNSYTVTLAYNLAIYAQKRLEYWREYMDCLESIQKVIFIQP